MRVENVRHGPTFSSVKAMKRLTATLLVALFLLLGAPQAAADTTDWTVDDANLSLAIPSDLAVATRAGIQSHPDIFESFQLTAEGLLELMTANHSYLNAIDPQAAYEYVVIVVEPTTEQRFWNFNSLSDAMLKEIGDGVAAEVEKSGYQAGFEEIVKVGDVTYVVLSGSAATGGDDYRQYYTTVNGRMTSVTMHSYTGPISAELAAEHRAIIDSVQFLSVVPDPNPEADPSRLLDQVQSMVMWAVIGGGVLLLGVIVLIVVLVRRRGKQAAAVVPPAGPVGYPPAPGQPPAPGPGVPPSQTPPPAPDNQPPSGPNGPVSG